MSRYFRQRPGVCVRLVCSAVLLGTQLFLSSQHNTALAQPGRQTQEYTPSLVFLGDSLTAGYQLSSAEAFPARVEHKLRAAGLKWKVVNAGVSGDTTAGGLARMGWVLKLKPTVLFVCLGANDGLRGLKIAETEKNLRAIIEKARQAGATPVMAGMRLPTNYGPQYENDFAAIYPRVAKDLSVPLLPFLLDKMAIKSDLTLSDGIHPNAKGAERIAETVWAFLEPILKEKQK